ncbi:MAG: pyridoxamine 5'-phosphate oxidase family protein [Spirochaetia bacterium]|jgi:nitroimidazol reductase NimA-like FMN-containing flavoprotein (pyridoxamine 5'-phosphate oxidase superfamily)|nr:pyridoxamine 5'-phosphate oxidase family protein [Spirochaetia bacterium]
MKKNYENPDFISKHKNEDDAGRRNAENSIKELLDSESFAVLSTQGEGQPYSSLISFACTDDLKKLVFATPSDTRKFSLITQSGRVSILIDNRSEGHESLNRLCAVTVTGRASVVKDKSEAEKWKKSLIKAHPYLEAFVKAGSSAVILVDAERYFFVKRFQEVIEWSPDISIV